MIEHNHVDEVFVEPLLVAIAEMNGDDHTITKPVAPKDEQIARDHEEMDKESRIATPDQQQYKGLNDLALDEFTLIMGTNALELSEMNG